MISGRREKRAKWILSKLKDESISFEEIKALSDQELERLKSQEVSPGKTIALSTLRQHIYELRSFIGSNLPDNLGDLHKQLKNERSSMMRVINSLYLPIKEHEEELKNIENFPIIKEIKQKITKISSQNPFANNIEDFLDCFRVPKHVDIALQQKNKENIKRDLMEVQKIDFYNFIKISRELLDAHNYFDKCIGLIALTGRRPTEIIKTGEFEAIDKDHVSFKGQLKTKESKHADDGIKIPVLDSPEKIIKTLKFIRKEKNFSTKTNIEAKQSTGKSISRHIEKIFPPALGNNITFTAKTLRRIYRAICVEYYCPEDQDDIVYGNYILGHSSYSFDVDLNYRGFRG